MDQFLLLADELGGSDCETIGDGFFAQPINALTSFGFVVAGLIIAVRGIRVGGPARWPAVAYGAILALVGLGSVAFHGPNPPGHNCCTTRLSPRRFSSSLSTTWGVSEKSVGCGSLVRCPSDW